MAEKAVIVGGKAAGVVAVELEKGILKDVGREPLKLLLQLANYS